jgi:uncharacterized membrane protein
MYPLHPLTVHLPIGLLLGNALLTLLYLRRGDRTLETSAYHCLWLGWFCTLPIAATGALDAVRHLYGPAPNSNALGWINAHALGAIALIVVYWQAWQARRRNPAILDDPRKRVGYLIRLASGVVLLVLTGWIGGHMVYTLRIGVGA